jgi:hypothetical protein
MEGISVSSGKTNWAVLVLSVAFSPKLEVMPHSLSFKITMVMLYSAMSRKASPVQMRPQPFP